MAAPITGKDGTVTADGADVAHVRQFSITETCESKPYTSSSNPGVTARLAGNTDWNGSLSVWADGGSLAAPFGVGDTVALELTADTGKHCTGDALITEITAEVDVAGAEIVGWQASFEGDGALTRA